MPIKGSDTMTNNKLNKMILHLNSNSWILTLIFYLTKRFRMHKFCTSFNLYTTNFDNCWQLSPVILLLTMTFPDFSAFRLFAHKLSSLTLAHRTVLLLKNLPLFCSNSSNYSPYKWETTLYYLYSHTHRFINSSKLIVFAMLV